MNILLIDDQAYMEELLAEELQDQGHVLKRIGESDLVMDSLEEDPPDVVLLDLYLNGFEGWRLLEEIKHFSQDLPVFILSAYDSFRDDSRLKAADGYLIKDIDTGEKVKDLIERMPGKESGATIEVSENGPSTCHKIPLNPPLKKGDDQRRLAH